MSDYPETFLSAGDTYTRIPGTRRQYTCPTRPGKFLLEDPAVLLPMRIGREPLPHHYPGGIAGIAGKYKPG